MAPKVEYPKGALLRLVAFYCTSPRKAKASNEIVDSAIAPRPIRAGAAARPVVNEAAPRPTRAPSRSAAASAMLPPARADVFGVRNLRRGSPEMIEQRLATDGHQMLLIELLQYREAASGRGGKAILFKTWPLLTDIIDYLFCDVSK